MTSRTLRLPDGRAVSVWEGGDPAGTPVLFFHGCPDSRRAAVTGHEPAARAGVRLVAASRPGYSATDVPGPVHPGTHLDVADDTVAVADALDLTGFAVLGMSVGGPYALATAARHPQRITAAGVVAAPADVPSLTPPVHRDGLGDEETTFFAGLAVTDPAASVEQLRPDFETWVAGLDPDDSNDDALAARWLAVLPEADRAAVAPLDSAELAAAAREAVGRSEGYLRDAAIAFRAWPFAVTDVRATVHAWYGGEDPNYSVRNGEWLAEHAGATLVVRDGATHLVTLVDHWEDMLVTLTRKTSVP